MRWFEFSKRNFKEILRDPISWVFMIALPILLFIVLNVMVKAIGEDISHTPQFEIKHLSASMIVFSYSFLTIFVGNNLAKDREERFLLRLKSTPMKSYDFVLGYTVSVLPFALIQEIAVVITGLILGLEASLNIVLLVIALLPVSLLFIGFGILFGSIASSKGVGGIASIIPTASSLLGGMFFPLSTMKGTFRTICDILPFSNTISIGQKIIGDTVENFSMSLIISIVYIVVIYALSISIFVYKLKRDSI